MNPKLDLLIKTYLDAYKTLLADSGDIDGKRVKELAALIRTCVKKGMITGTAYDDLTKKIEVLETSYSTFSEKFYKKYSICDMNMKSHRLDLIQNRLNFNNEEVLQKIHPAPLIRQEVQTNNYQPLALSDNILQEIEAHLSLISTQKLTALYLESYKNLLQDQQNNTHQKAVGLLSPLVKRAITDGALIGPDYEHLLNEMSTIEAKYREILIKDFYQKYSICDSPIDTHKLKIGVGIKSQEEVIRQVCVQEIADKIINNSYSPLPLKPEIEESIKKSMQQIYDLESADQKHSHENQRREIPSDDFGESTPKVSKEEMEILFEKYGTSHSMPVAENLIEDYLESYKDKIKFQYFLQNHPHFDNDQILQQIEKHHTHRAEEIAKKLSTHGPEGIDEQAYFEMLKSMQEVRESYLVPEVGKHATEQTQIQEQSVAFTQGQDVARAYEEAEKLYQHKQKLIALLKSDPTVELPKNDIQQYKYLLQKIYKLTALTDEQVIKHLKGQKFTEEYFRSTNTLQPKILADLQEKVNKTTQILLQDPDITADKKIFLEKQQKLRQQQLQLAMLKPKASLVYGLSLKKHNQQYIQAEELKKIREQQESLQKQHQEQDKILNSRIEDLQKRVAENLKQPLSDDTLNQPRLWFTNLKPASLAEHLKDDLVGKKEFIAEVSTEQQEIQKNLQLFQEQIHTLAQEQKGLEEQWQQLQQQQQELESIAKEIEEDTSKSIEISSNHRIEQNEIFHTYDEKPLELTNPEQVHLKIQDNIVDLSQEINEFNHVASPQPENMSKHAASPIEEQLKSGTEIEMALPKNGVMLSTPQNSGAQLEAEKEPGAALEADVPNKKLDKNKPFLLLQATISDWRELFKAFIENAVAFLSPHVNGLKYLSAQFLNLMNVSQNLTYGPIKGMRDTYKEQRAEGHSPLKSALKAVTVGPFTDLVNKYKEVKKEGRSPLGAVMKLGSSFVSELFNPTSIERANAAAAGKRNPYEAARSWMRAAVGQNKPADLVSKPIKKRVTDVLSPEYPQQEENARKELQSLQSSGNDELTDASHTVGGTPIVHQFEASQTQQREKEAAERKKLREDAESQPIPAHAFLTPKSTPSPPNSSNSP